jgi:hypothetical protein
LPVPLFHRLTILISGLAGERNVDIVHWIDTHSFRDWDGCGRSCRALFPSNHSAISVCGEDHGRRDDVLRPALGSASLCSLRTNCVCRVRSSVPPPHLDGFRHRKDCHRCTDLLRANEANCCDDYPRNVGWNLGHPFRHISCRAVGRGKRATKATTQLPSRPSLTLLVAREPLKFFITISQWVPSHTHNQPNAIMAM